jgi:hypothetical protein
MRWATALVVALACASPFCAAGDEPDFAEVLRLLPRANQVPGVHEVHRDDIRCTIEKVADRTDMPRFFPFVGMAKLHHRSWRCTVTFTETVEAQVPLPFRVQRKRTEVLFIDRDRLLPVMKLGEVELQQKVAADLLH